jgi:adenylate kinase
MYRKRSSTFTLALAFAVVVPTGAQLQAPRTMILIGPPGSGKTVQAEALRKKYKIPVVSMSQLLHQEIDRKSPVGEALAASLESGELLGDEAANDLVKTRLLQPDAGNGFILDGYPATADQARALDKWLSEHNLPQPTIIVLNVPAEVSRDRLIRRRRAGDQPVNIERRLRDYREIGRLVEQWYGTEGVVRVDGTGAPADVTLQIAKGIDGVASRKSLKVRSPKAGDLKRREDEQSTTEQKQ